MDGGPFLVYFLPILGGQKTAVSDSTEGWCATPGLFPSHYRLISARMIGQMDRRQMTRQMTGQMTGCTDSGAASFVIPTSFNICNDYLNPQSFSPSKPLISITFSGVL